MIFGGYSEEYPTIRTARNSIHTLLKGPPKASSSGPIMRFDATTSQTLQQPHTDPLVVTLKNWANESQEGTRRYREHG